MTKADLDLAHATAAKLMLYARYIDQIGNAGMAAAARTAAELLTKMVEEAEARESADG
jgi:hypothetical protein